MRVVFSAREKRKSDQPGHPRGRLPTSSSLSQVIHLTVLKVKQIQYVNLLPPYGAVNKLHIPRQRSTAFKLHLPLKSNGKKRVSR